MILLEGDKVKIQNVSEMYNGKIGIVSKWHHDNWYSVRVDEKEILVCSALNEVTKIKENFKNGI